MSLFNKIAPLYGLFFNFQVKYFNKIQDRASKEVDILSFKTVLDIGCGTGALCRTLYEKGLEVVGIDPSEKMLDQARNKLRDTNIKLTHILSGEKFPFEDKSFDIVITSYVVHGLKPNERIKLYKEMKRLAKDKIIIHDYNSTRGIITTIAEWLENGDYFNFIKVAKKEMKEVFESVKVINVDTRAAWYICDMDIKERYIKE